MIDLPPELIGNILDKAEPRDIVTCRQVCRKLNEIILESSPIQYKVELAFAGYTNSPAHPEDPPNKRVADMRQLRKSWEDVSWNNVTEISASFEGTTYEVQGGLFVSGEPGLAGAHSTEGLSFFALPKRDRLSEDQHVNKFHSWRFNLRMQVHDFQVDPCQDLMVLIEKHPPPTADATPSPHPPLTVHLRTITSNQPHPLSALPIVAFNDIASIQENSFIIQVLDDIIGILVKPMMYGFLSREMDKVIIWNWKTGHVLAYLPTFAIDSLVFLSDRMVMFPMSNRLPSLLSLDVYSFPLDGPLATSISPTSPLPEASIVLPPKPTFLASFYLPSLIRRPESLVERMTCRCEPAPSYRSAGLSASRAPSSSSSHPSHSDQRKTSTSPSPPNSPPPPSTPLPRYASLHPIQIPPQNSFHPSPESRLIVLSLSTLTFDLNAGRLQPDRSFTIFMRAETLRELALHHSKVANENASLDATVPSDGSSSLERWENSFSPAERGVRVGIPWVVWGPKHTRWMEMATARAWIVYSYASRFAYGIKQEDKTQVRILDFNPVYANEGKNAHTTQNHSLSDEGNPVPPSNDPELVTGSEVDPSPGGEVVETADNTIRIVRSSSLVGANGTFKRDIVTHLPYREMTSRQSFGDINGIMIDGERIMLMDRDTVGFSVWNV